MALRAAANAVVAEFAKRQTHNSEMCAHLLFSLIFHSLIFLLSLQSVFFFFFFFLLWVFGANEISFVHKTMDGWVKVLRAEARTHSKLN